MVLVFSNEGAQPAVERPSLARVPTSNPLDAAADLAERQHAELFFVVSCGHVPGAYAYVHALALAELRDDFDSIGEV